MQKVHLSSINVKNVKKFFHCRLSMLFAVLLVGIASALSLFVFSAHPTKKVAAKQSCCGEASFRRMIGTYYNTRDNWKSTLVLNNKGPNPIAITPILYSMGGKKFIAPVINIGGQSAYELYLNDLAATAGPGFVDGSYEFTYTGRLLEMGAGLRITGEEKNLIFDEQLTEPGVRFSSPRAEAVYAIPYKSAKAVLILTNTTEKSFSVSGIAVDQEINVNLGAHQTEIINLKESRKGIGAVSLNQTGGGGSAMLAMVHVSEPERGFSVAIPFTDPLMAKTNQIQGAGLRLGRLNGKRLTPMIAVRNVGEAETSVFATIPLGHNGKMDRISLPRLRLVPGEAKLFDTSDVPTQRIDSDALAGLEIEYQGVPGSVVASAMSLTPNGGEVFPLLTRDPQSITSSTGGYAWFAEEEYSTTVYIKNVTDKSQMFHLNVVYEQGRWGSNVKRLAPGETYAINIKQTRDAQVKGSEGNTIPLNAEKGHVYWSILGTKEKGLIGRAETVDPTGGMASTYECQTCHCYYGFNDQRITPGSANDDEPGDTRTFVAEQQDLDCYLNPCSWMTPTSPITWGTYDSNIATVNSSGVVTAQNEGTTSVTVSWEAHRYTWGGEEICNDTTFYPFISAGFTTKPPIPHHLEVRDDTTSVAAGCTTGSFLRREVSYRVVNKYNRPCGIVRVKELFPGTITSSCLNPPATVSPSACANSDDFPDGTFVDRLQSGCDNTVTDPYCGHEIYPNRWQWCPTGGTVKTLATMDYFIHRNYISINGVTYWEPGTYFYP